MLVNSRTVVTGAPSVRVSVVVPAWRAWVPLNAAKHGELVVMEEADVVRDAGTVQGDCISMLPLPLMPSMDSDEAGREGEGDLEQRGLLREVSR